VIVDGRAHLDLLDLDDLLLLARFGGFLLLFIFELAVVHQLDDGRLRLGRDFDEVEAFFFRDGAAFVEADLAVFVTVVSDQEDGAGKDFFVDARAIFGGRRRVTGCKTSGDYDSLSCVKPARTTIIPRGSNPASRNVVTVHGQGENPQAKAVAGPLMPGE
jgi:hypothetical protein